MVSCLSVGWRAGSLPVRTGGATSWLARGARAAKLVHGKAGNLNMLDFAAKWAERHDGTADGQRLARVPAPEPVLAPVPGMPGTPGDVPEYPAWLPAWLRLGLEMEPAELAGEARTCRARGALNETADKCMQLVAEAPDGVLKAYATRYMVRLGRAIGQTANEDADEAMPRIARAVQASADGDTRPLLVIEAETRRVAPVGTEKCLGLLGMSHLMRDGMREFHDFKRAAGTMQDGVLLGRRSEDLREAVIGRNNAAIAAGRPWEIVRNPLRPTLSAALGIRGNDRPQEQEDNAVRVAMRHGTAR